jgi:hypothetical protein
MIIELPLFSITGNKKLNMMFNTNHIVTIEPSPTDKVLNGEPVKIPFVAAKVYMINGEGYLLDNTYEEVKSIIKNHVQGGEI